jgi:tripartite-type tricarboxylate transporter receptor subunit TctC
MKKLIISLTLGILSIVSLAADFPTRPIHIITFAPVGSGPDNVMRKIAEVITANLQVPVLVDNKPGANGALAIDAFLKEPADGYQLLMTDINSMVLHQNDVTKDIKPLTTVLQSDMFIITSPKITSLDDLKNAVKIKGSFGSWGVASAPHLLGVEFAQNIGASAIHIPYKDYNQWFIDTSNGELTYSFATAGSANRLVKVNKLRYLAVASNRRNADLPDVPTVQELTGKPINELRPWMAFYINRATAINVESILQAEFVKAIRSESVQKAIKSFDYSPMLMPSSEASTLMQSEIALYKKLFKTYNISVSQ